MLISDADSPLVSVLIPAYNVGPFVKESIESILSQSYSNLEVLVFNDGSKDNTAEIIRSIKDQRLHFFDSVDNKGYVSHLNHGLQLARGKYIARMDADDISLPDRIAKQVAFMEENPGIGVCGTWMEIIGRPDIIVRTPITDAEIRYELLSNSPLAHPTVMIRASVLHNFSVEYNKEFMPAEDYFMWYTLSKHTKLANLGEVLLLYRRHDGQISSYRTELQRKRADEVRIIQLESLGFELTEKEKEVYCKLVENSLLTLSYEDYVNMKKVMDKLVEQNDIIKAFNSDDFLSFLKTAWQRTVYYIRQYHPALLKGIFITKSKRVNTSLGLKSSVIVMMKCMINWKMRV